MPRSQQPGAERSVFRAYFDLTAVVGTTVEILNGASSGKEVRIRRIQVAIGGAAQLTAKKTTVAASGGTSGALTPSQARTGDTAAATGKTYSVAPTTGTVECNWDTYNAAAAIFWDTGEKPEPNTGCILQQGQQFALFSTAAVTLKGFIEYWEDPV